MRMVDAHGEQECTLHRFRSWLSSLVSQIPPGQVASYGSLASALGDGRAARAVAEELSRLDAHIPVHRAVDREGTVRRGDALLSLAAEHVIVGEGRVSEATPRFGAFDTAYPLGRLRAAQQELSRRVLLHDGGRYDTVTGVDVAYAADQAAGAAVTLSLSAGEVIEGRVARAAPGLPYIPTYLGFRELPVIRAVLGLLHTPPEVLMIDGNGILHPCGFGSACHIGVALNIPTVGVAKRLLCGMVHGEGSVADVRQGGRRAGWAVRAGDRARNPVFVSPGNLVSMGAALRLAQRLLVHRVPEPVRRADALARAAVRRG